MFSAPTDFRHLEGLKLGPEGVQMVNNIDPVLLKFIDHAGLKIEDMREEQLKKVEEIALENGILGRQSSEKKKRIMSKPSILPPSPKPPTHRPPPRVRQSPSTRPLPSSPAPVREGAQKKRFFGDFVPNIGPHPTTVHVWDSTK